MRPKLKMIKITSITLLAILSIVIIIVLSRVEQYSLRDQGDQFYYGKTCSLEGYYIFLDDSNAGRKGSLVVLVYNDQEYYDQKISDLNSRFKKYKSHIGKLNFTIFDRVVYKKFPDSLDFFYANSQSDLVKGLTLKFFSSDFEGFSSYHYVKKKNCKQVGGPSLGLETMESQSQPSN